MIVQCIKNDFVSFNGGLYFTRANVSFDKGAQLLNMPGEKLSNDGFKYIEQTNIPASVVKKFKNNKFIKNISEKFDTFVMYEEIKGNKKYSSNNIAFAKIWWFDNIRNSVQYKGARGISRTSTERASEQMFKELK